jgi:hypothetical protein
MYLKLSNIPNWVFENSEILKTLKEDCINENNNELNYIPFLTQYDDNQFDFSNIFQKENSYLNLDNYMTIYLDIFQFLDFICFEIPFYQLIQPKNYYHLKDIFESNNKLKTHFEKNIKGVQHYAFHMRRFNNNVHLFNYNNNDDFSLNESNYLHTIDNYIKESIELDQYDWLFWFIKNVNSLNQYEDLLFKFDYTNVSLKTFDLLYNINKVCYPNICESIVKYRKSELFQKYVKEIKKTYNDEALFKPAFERHRNEDLIKHCEFVKLILNHGYKFHFVYEYSKNTYYSNNPLLMKYMYENYKEVIDKNVVDICPVLHYLCFNSNICTYQEKCDILDFFIKNYNGIFKMNKLLQFVFRIENRLDNNDKDKYDLPFILTFMERTEHHNNIYSYMVYLYFNYKPGIENYINDSEMNKYDVNKFTNTGNYDVNKFTNTGNYDVNKFTNTGNYDVNKFTNTGNYDVNKFTNTFKYVLCYKNVDYVNLYITHKLYSSDNHLYDNSYYIKYATYDINIFKTLYKNKIGNIHLNDILFMDAYNNCNPNVILFMLEHKYVPSKTVKNMISHDYHQHIGINQVEINGIIQVEKYYSNIEFINKEKIYHMICVN